MASYKQPTIAKRGDAKLDLAFVMDCTSSMDAYINEARDNIIQIVDEIVESEDCDIRLALVQYRDHPPADESFVTIHYDFTDSAGKMKGWLRECYAAGGGDIPEAVADGLNELTKLSWRKDATKISVLVTDAPPHGLGAYRDAFKDGCPLGLDPMEIARQLAGKGISVYVAGCEPSILAYKHFYLAVAHITGGQYVPLENAQDLVKIIIYGSQEEMSLKKLEVEVEKEIENMTKTGKLMNEAKMSTLLHSKWLSRGEKAKQLTLNQQGLATAVNSVTAMDITKMNFDAVKTLYKTTTPSDRKSRDADENKVEDGSGMTDLEMQTKLTTATKALAELQCRSTKHGEVPITIDTKGLASLVADGSESARSCTQADASSKALVTATDGRYQCIDGGVTLSQTMRLVQKSMMKMSRISDN